MTLCIKTGYQCVCQPDEGAFCPDYKPDAYVQYLMDAITELRASREPVALVSMSMRAFGSPDSLASYCIKRAHRERVSEWKIVYDLLYQSSDDIEQRS